MIFCWIKKLAGILCEGKLYQNHMEYLIIGIGINVHSFIRSKELESIAASIEDYTAIKNSQRTDCEVSYCFLLLLF